jgi:hypothetical protein
MSCLTSVRDMLKDFTAVRSAIWVAAVVMVFGSARVSRADHSAGISIIHDAFPPVYTGTSHPAGSFHVNVVAPAPGYFNGMSGGSDGGAYGEVAITPADFGQTQLAALAIHVTDAAGASHSLSTLNDPALADIVNDLNVPFNISADGDPGIAYPFAAAPPQYAAAVATLAAGEALNGGQPFDILVALTYPEPPAGDFAWYLSLANEIGNLDGITALSVTDVGGMNIPAVPEPVGLSLLSLPALLLLRRRH